MSHAAPFSPAFQKHLNALLRGLPLLAGSLVKQYVICGKPGCRCQRGHQHGPLFYLYWKEEGRSRSLYVPRDQAPELRQQIQNYRRLQRDLARRVRRQLRAWQRHFQEEHHR